MPYPYDLAYIETIYQNEEEEMRKPIDATYIVNSATDWEWQEGENEEE